MDIEEFRKAALPGTGLVPMKVMRSFMPYIEGQVAGFPPEVAFAHANVGNLELFKGDKKAATSALAHSGPLPGSGSPAAVPGAAPAAIRSTLYDRQPEVTPRAQTAPNTVAQPTAPTPPATEIPENWQDLPTSSKRGLAADLSGRNYREISGDEATAIIEAALQGKQAGEPATGTKATPTGPQKDADTNAPGQTTQTGSAA